jgi:hypothetical protein
MSCPKCPPKRPQPRRFRPGPVTWMLMVLAVVLTILFAREAAHAASETPQSSARAGVRVSTLSTAATASHAMP